MAGNAVAGVHPDCVAIFSEHPIRAVVHTALAEHALVGIDLDFISKRDAAYCHAITLPMTGSPAFGIVIVSISGLYAPDCCFFAGDIEAVSLFTGNKRAQLDPVSKAYDRVFVCDTDCERTIMRADPYTQDESPD